MLISSVKICRTILMVACVLLVVFSITKRNLVEASADAFYPEAKADEVYVDAGWLQQVYLVALGYKPGQMGLSKMVVAQGYGELIDYPKSKFTKWAVVDKKMEWKFLEILQCQYREMAYRNFLHYRSSSGFFWKMAAYDEQVYLNLLGYRAGFPTGDATPESIAAKEKFINDHGLEGKSRPEIAETLKRMIDTTIFEEQLPLIMVKVTPINPVVHFPQIPGVLMKKDELATVYLSILGERAELSQPANRISEIHFLRKLESLSWIDLPRKLQSFQKKYPEMTQTQGEVTDQVLNELEKKSREVILESF